MIQLTLDSDAVELVRLRQAFLKVSRLDLEICVRAADTTNAIELGNRQTPLK